MRPLITYCCFILLTMGHLNGQTRPKLNLQIFSSGYADPLAVRNDGVNNWLYVVQRNGNIFLADSNGIKSAVPFLNISSIVLAGGERGLLGLAFDPDYADNRRFYVNYTRSGDGATVIASFKSRADDPTRADSLSLKIILTIPQPQANHNGGDIHFAKDGYLYIGMGDGGGTGDPNNLAQNLNQLLGKMLRIKIETDSTYSIPPDNPFVGNPSAKPEIWALGLRNPWRFSFDRLTDDLWIADVGQSAREEVDFVPAPRTPGLNFGWRCYEAENVYNNNGCGPIGNYYAPVFSYDRSSTGGRSITGGFVYRGSDHPDLYGYYVCADYLSRNFWMLKQFDTLEVIPQLNLLQSVVTFGEDVSGELYLASFNGNVYKVGSICSNLKLNNSTITNATCQTASNGSITTEISTNNGALTYEWSVPGISSGINSLSPGTYSLKVTDSAGCWLTASFDVGFDSLEAPVISRSGDTLLISEAGEYQWLLNGAAIDGATNAFYIPTESGDYTVVFTDDDGCTVTTAAFNFQLSNSREQNLAFSIYPNPGNYIIQINLSDLSSNNGSFSISDISGKHIRSGFVNNGRNTISVTDLTPGWYLIHVTDNQTGMHGIGRFLIIR